MGSGKLVVVDRANLDKVRSELGFQMSGEVSDDSAKSIGQMVGVGAIVTGSLTNIGTLYSLTLKAIDVAKAVVAVSFPADITNDERVRALLGQSGIAAAEFCFADLRSGKRYGVGSGGSGKVGSADRAGRSLCRRCLTGRNGPVGHAGLDKHKRQARWEVYHRAWQRRGYYPHGTELRRQDGYDNLEKRRVRTHG
ncbi:hypothetical protein FACS189494_12190 [Spirochaetia bacterium]|nr:hypothetical protein FACS189494_12190 [Spirochaetia bacterium]